MISLTAAVLFFLLIHLLVSGTTVRDALVRKIGEGRYMGLFSLSSLLGIAWLALAYARARAAPEQTFYWMTTPATRHIQMGITLVAFLFIVIGVTTPNPTSVRQGDRLRGAPPIRGMLRVSRHPFLWGVTLWAAGHLMVNVAHRPGFHSREIVREANGNIRITVSASVESGNWLPIAAVDRFKLVLRFYDTPLTTGSQIADLVMPAIQKVECP